MPAVHANHTPNQPGNDPRAALERLAAGLDGRAFVTTLTVRPGQPPRLTVTSRLTRLGDDIHADAHSYWWSRLVPLGPINDPQAAAGMITTALRATPPPAHD